MLEGALGRLDNLAQPLVVTLAGDGEAIGEFVKIDQRCVVEGVGCGSAKMAHVRTGTKGETEIVTQFADVGAALAFDPEQGLLVTAVQQVERVDFAHAEPPADRALSWRFLVEWGLKTVKDGLGIGRLWAVEFQDGNVLLATFKKHLRQPCRIAQQHRETARDFRVQRASVGRAVDCR
jgi:hypothetical protein